jgi:hypothetical protein
MKLALAAGTRASRVVLAHTEEVVQTRAFGIPADGR